MNLSIGDLLEYRSALYGGRNIPVDVQIFFVENELRKVEVIAGAPQDLFDVDNESLRGQIEEALRSLRSASRSCSEAETECDEVAELLRALLKKAATA